MIVYRIVGAPLRFETVDRRSAMRRLAEIRSNYPSARMLGEYRA